jgi:sugar phosphate permease
MISLIMLGGVLNYLTRNTLSVAQVRLQDTLHITEQQYSWITATFQCAIMLQPIVGYVLDVVGPADRAGDLRHGMGGHQHAARVGRSWRGLAVMRGLMGLRRGVGQPVRRKGDGRSGFPARERGLAAGIYNIGASLGSMLAPPLVARRIYYYNWQSRSSSPGAWASSWVGPVAAPLPVAVAATMAVGAGEVTPHRRGNRNRRGWRTDRPSVGESWRSATSGASRFRGSSPTRCGERCRSGCRSTCLRCAAGISRQISMFRVAAVPGGRHGVRLGGLVSAVCQKHTGISIVNAPPRRRSTLARY